MSLHPVHFLLSPDFFVVVQHATPSSNVTSYPLFCPKQTFLCEILYIYLILLYVLARIHHKICQLPGKNK